MVIQEDGVCDACHACHNKTNHSIDWAERERELRELCDQYRKTDGSYDCLVRCITPAKKSRTTSTRAILPTNTKKPQQQSAQPEQQ